MEGKKRGSVTYIVSSAAVIRVVTQCFWWGEALHDDPNNGCRGDYNLQYRLKNEVSKIFIINISTVCLTGSGAISIHAERLQIFRKQNESI